MTFRKGAVILFLVCLSLFGTGVQAESGESDSQQAEIGKLGKRIGELTVQIVKEKVEKYLEELRPEIERIQKEAEALVEELERELEPAIEEWMRKLEKELERELERLEKPEKNDNDKDLDNTV